MTRRNCLLTLVLLATSTSRLTAQAPSAPAPAGDSTVCCAMRTNAPSTCPMQREQPCRGQPGGMMGQPGHRMAMGGTAQMPMPGPAEQARLDSLVTTMHQSKGDRKLAAMEKVIDELLAQRRAMADHMRHMMEHRPGAPAADSEPDHSQHQ